MLCYVMEIDMPVMELFRKYLCKPDLFTVKATPVYVETVALFGMWMTRVAR